MTLRALVVDDEPLARRGMVRLVRDTPGFEIAGEARDSSEAVAAVRALHPGLVLLDIEMPGGSGFEVIRQIGPERMPPVVFVTAHDYYAIRAFEEQAFDYVLKPFEDLRIRAVLRRVEGLSSLSDLARRLRALVDEAAAPPRLTSLARAMLVEIEPQRPRRPPAEWLSRVADELRSRFAEPVGLSDLAAVAGVHPVYLARAFRAHFGTSLGGFLRKLRVDRAAEQLVSTDLPIADIALASGFSDQSHLTRLFHRAFGITPARYRERFRR